MNCEPKQILNFTWSMNGERCRCQMVSSQYFKHLQFAQLHRSPFMDHGPFMILRKSEFIHTFFSRSHAANAASGSTRLRRAQPDKSRLPTDSRQPCSAKAIDR